MKKIINRVIILGIITLSIYGAFRGYYAWTDGFALGNIQREISYENSWVVRAPTSEEKELLPHLLQQRFVYLGKGCQSYVFQSEDGKYVMKFIKHQRFRTKPWLDAFSFIPFLQTYREERMAHKKEKLRKLLVGWQTAYNELPHETGVVWLNLNEKSHSLPLNIKIVDKMGFSHQLDLQNFQFIIQCKAEMLCLVLENLINDHKEAEAQALIDRILVMIANIYQAGFADHDHALMQNTGVVNGYPLPIDVGQFVKEPSAANPEFYHQALFNKTYRFRIWLEEKSPPLQQYLETRLKSIIGTDFDSMRPHFDV